MNILTAIALCHEMEKTVPFDIRNVHPGIFGIQVRAAEAFSCRDWLKVFIILSLVCFSWSLDWNSLVHYADSTKQKHQFQT